MHEMLNCSCHNCDKTIADFAGEFNPVTVKLLVIDLERHCSNCGAEKPCICFDLYKYIKENYSQSDFTRGCLYKLPAHFKCALCIYLKKTSIFED